MDAFQQRRIQAFHKEAKEIKKFLAYYDNQLEKLQRDSEYSGIFHKKHMALVLQGIKECDRKLADIDYKLNSDRKLNAEQ